MITTTNTRTSRRFAKRLAAVGVGATLLATGAIGVQTLASENEGDDPLPPPGSPPTGEEAGDVPMEAGDLVLGSSEIIQTGGGNFDPTILTKYIGAGGFQPLQGEGANADTVAFDGAAGDTCVRPGPASAGTLTRLNAAVELPDGARIKQISFYGQDDSAAGDIAVRLVREDFSTPLVFGGMTPVSSRSRTVVDAFSTSGQQNDASVFFGTDNLEDVTGSFNSFAGVALGPRINRFHVVSVALLNAAGADHVLCGVRVDYQVPASADPGVTFHPLEPFRAFDSRQAAFPESGRLAPNATKVIDITDGYDSNGVLIPAQENLIPANATAITYNITAAGQTGPNFVAVTAGDAVSFTASAINYSGGANIANAGTVEIDGAQSIKLWGGGNTGSAHVLIDVTGFYAPAPFPNMGN